MCEAIISFIGAGISIWQAYKAKSYADGINDAKNDVKQKNEIVEHSKLMAESHDLIRNLASVNNGKMKLSEAMMYMDDYLSDLSKINGIIKGNDKTDLENFYKGIKGLKDECIENENDVNEKISKMQEFLHLIIKIISRIVNDHTYSC